MPKNYYYSIISTTGVIERDKGIYFAPYFSSPFSGYLSTAWLTELDGQLDDSINYQSPTPMSQWNPEDRTLSVPRETFPIEVFRCAGLGGGKNYLIIFELEDNTYIPRYCYFIDSARVSGLGTIQLTISPDHFTNVFYMRKEHYSPTHSDHYNNIIKNAHVERQHYDRVKKETTTRYFYTYLEKPYNKSMIYTGAYYLFPLSDFQRLVGTGQLINVVTSSVGAFDYGFVNSISNNDLRNPLSSTSISGRALTVNIGYLSEGDGEGEEVFTVDGRAYDVEKIKNLEYGKYFYVKYWAGSFATFSNADMEYFIIYKRESETETKILPTNQDIFLNTPETYKYKYQYRDRKDYLSLNEEYQFTDEDIEELKTKTSWDSLSFTVQTKALFNSVGYLNVIFKDDDMFAKKLRFEKTGTSNDDTIIYENIFNKTKISRNGDVSPIYLVVYPYLSIPIKELYKYEDEIKNRINNVYYVNYMGVSRALSRKINDDYKFSSNSLLEDVSKGIYTSHIQSIFLTKYSNLNYSFVATDNGLELNLCNYSIRDFQLSGTVNISSIVYLPKEIVGEDDYPQYTFYKTEDESRILDETGVWNIGYISEEYYNIETTIKLKEKEYSDELLKTDYYDPVLETQPYSFYTISFLGDLETTLYKEKYYQSLDSEGNYNVKFTYISTFVGGNKSGLIPTYNINGFESIHFSDALVNVSSDSFPMNEDSYYNYYFTNMAQMKNQFAVNEVNRWSELGLGAMTAGGQIAGGFVQGTAKGISTTIGQSTNLVTNFVKSYVNEKIIDMNQQAILADVGRKPDTVKASGSDIYYTLKVGELGYYLNHYTIDTLSYNSIAKMLERFGYKVELYDTLNAFNRVGYNYIKLYSMDFNTPMNIEQEESVRAIFKAGITLLHEKSVLDNGHNYERILE